MDDSSDERPDERPPDSARADESEDVRTLRRDVAEKYDFENFGPADMAEMSYEEWDAAFDPDTWITGEELLDRVEADLKRRVADRDVFAVVERIEQDTAEQSSASNRTRSDEGESRLLAYSDEGYAVVYPDGSVEGRGTVLRDVKPTVALASMDSYEVPEAPESDALPDPAEVPEGSGQLGNQLMQVIAAVHFVAGVGLLLSGPLFGVDGRGLVIAIVAGLGFLLFSVFVFLLVANARLSDRFRAEEYRNRLRAVGTEGEDRPAFLAEEGVSEPTDDGASSRAEEGVSTSPDDGN